MFNFRLDWFGTFRYTWRYIMFHDFGWKLAIQGQIFRVLGVNRGQISIFHFITQKETFLRDSASFEPLRVKICPGSLLYAGPRKNSHTQKYISPFAQRSPVNGFLSNLEKNASLVDLINPDKLCVILFKGFDFTAVKISIFPIGKLTSPL